MDNFTFTYKLTNAFKLLESLQNVSSLPTKHTPPPQKKAVLYLEMTDWQLNCSIEGENWMSKYLQTKRNDSFSGPFFVVAYTSFFFGFHLFVFHFFMTTSSFTPYTEVGHASHLSKRHWNNLIKRIGYTEGWSHRTRTGRDERQRLKSLST
jgi:hypothetical protein